MLLRIPNVLDEDDLGAARAALAEAEFVDGTATAGWYARLVKHNEQIDEQDRSLDPVRQRIQARLSEHALFQLAVRPKALVSLQLSRYRPSMDYGAHVDNSLIGGRRTDVSFTLFLSPPDNYQGGELVIVQPIGEHRVKLQAGDAFVYPSTTLHRVEPVREGERLAAVGWVQSFVRDEARRDILFDLETARQSLFQKAGKTTEFDLLSKCGANLMRMWADG